MLKSILPRYAILLLNFETRPNEISTLLRYCIIESDRLAHDIVDELDLILGWPRGTSMHHLIVNEPN
jgi:hypothetical protein